MSDLVFSLISFFIIALAILYIWSIVWGYQDAVKRNKPGLAIALLIALFAWPFGLLFWVVIRPEKNMKKVKPVNLSEPNQYLDSFRQMSWIMKLFIIFSIYWIFPILRDLFTMKTVTFQMLGLDIPPQLSPLWHIYSLLINIYTLLVFFRRSASALMIYIYVSLLSMVPILFKCIYFVVNLPTEQRMATSIVYIATFTFMGLMYLHFAKQKQYFSKP